MREPSEHVAQRRPTSLSDGESQDDALYASDESDAGLTLGDSPTQSRPGPSLDSTENYRSPNLVWLDATTSPKPVPRCEVCGLFLSVKKVKGYWKYSRYCRYCGIRRAWKEGRYAGRNSHP